MPAVRRVASSDCLAAPKAGKDRLNRLCAQRCAHDLLSVRGILALGPRACNRLKQRVTFAIACFGSLAAQQALSRKDAFDFCTQCGHVGACG